jgi:hypothetical protein
MEPPIVFVPGIILILAAVGVALLGGLVLGLVLMTTKKSRPAGIVLLALVLLGVAAVVLVASFGFLTLRPAPVSQHVHTTVAPLPPQVATPTPPPQLVSPADERRQPAAVEIDQPPYDADPAARVEEHVGG